MINIIDEAKAFDNNTFTVTVFTPLSIELHLFPGGHGYKHMGQQKGWLALFIGYRNNIFVNNKCQFSCI